VILRGLARIAKFVAIGAAILYAVDWGVFEIQMARGAGMGTVAVEQFTQIPLKGNKLEFDYNGTANQSCSRSLFPQYSAANWNTPCWWLERHKTQWEKTENRTPTRVASKD
jgi:hypothetical protein